MRTLAISLLFALAAACGPSAGNNGDDDPNTDGGGVIVCGDAGACDVCTETGYIACNADCSAAPEVACPESCAPGLGCATACEVADEAPSNVGCEFWAVDLDQQDGFNDPASAPWGVVMSNVGETPAEVTIEINTAAVGQPVVTEVVWQGTVVADALVQQILPTRELDCGAAPNQYTSPGTCLSSRAYRIRSTQPIVAYQFNVFTNTYSNDASLLLPTNALGRQYRNLGWGAGHPIYIAQFGVIDRSYMSIVGVTASTEVTVRPSWRIKGNPPIAATAAGGDITVILGPFDVLNLETDDGTFQDPAATIADLSGSLIQASAPVAVFSGVETAAAPGPITIPTAPGWTSGDSCCLDHLEDQLFPMTSVGMHYVITRSPVRSTGSYREPDVLRFVGVAEDAIVTTTLPAPFDSFALAPGEVKTTWTQTDVVVTATKPVMVGQILISQEYVDGPYLGDPALTVFPPVEQYRTEYLFLTPSSWNQNWVVISAEVGSTITIDGAAPAGCIVESAGTIEGVAYEARRCRVSEGAHRLSGDLPFGITAYGYGTAGSYAFAGGADVEPVYEVPPILSEARQSSGERSGYGAQASSLALVSRCRRCSTTKAPFAGSNRQRIRFLAAARSWSSAACAASPLPLDGYASGAWVSSTGAAPRSTTRQRAASSWVQHRSLHPVHASLGP